jgi:pimeloyl-ACP methyl ester carboxylesterase
VAPSTAGTTRPGLGLFLSDFPRAAGDFALYLAAAPLLRRAAPRGDGHPVLVLPGLMAADTSTRALRGYLRRLGYHVHGWRLGRNVGPTREAIKGMGERLDALLERHGRTVSVIGWSLGGIYAREMARLRPDDVRQVITLGSPFNMKSGDESRAHRTYERFAHLHVDRGALRSGGTAVALAVPATSVFTKLDGIVSWRACLDEVSPLSENVAVYGAHAGLGHNPAALWVIADRLALAEGEWKPFVPPRGTRHLFPRGV